MDIAIVDGGGNLKAHVWMDSANIGNVTINKAYATIAIQCATGNLQVPEGKANCCPVDGFCYGTD